MTVAHTGTEQSKGVGGCRTDFGGSCGLADGLDVGSEEDRRDNG